MIKKIGKILKNSRTFSREQVKARDCSEYEAAGAQLRERICKLFSGSMAIRQVDAGSDNACEQELVALAGAFYDLERFGVNFVASPRHADLLLVSGPVTRNMADALKDAYEATPTPKIVVAFGDDAIDGGMFRGSYAVAGGVSSVVPVDYCIPGDPPSPLDTIRHLLVIMEKFSLGRTGIMENEL